MYGFTNVLRSYSEYGFVWTEPKFHLIIPMCSPVYLVTLNTWNLLFCYYWFEDQVLLVIQFAIVNIVSPAPAIVLYCRPSSFLSAIFDSFFVSHVHVLRIFVSNNFNNADTIDAFLYGNFYMLFGYISIAMLRHHLDNPTQLLLFIFIGTKQ